MNKDIETISPPGVNNLTIKVVYDNNPYKGSQRPYSSAGVAQQELGTAWGFSAFITGTDPQPRLATEVAGAWKNILFDTGGDGSLLLSNMKKLAIEPNRIDVVVLSHIHGDHSGGLASFLQKNQKTEVFLPEAFPKKFKDSLQQYQAKVIEVQQPLKICENVYSAGQFGKWIKEQSLIIRTKSGLVVIIGCAHPGIVKMVSMAKDLIKDDILLVMGGFHLEWATKAKIEKIISAFKQLGVQYVGPCHCTGEKARHLFENHFGKNYINIGVGKVITLADLQ
ncbi:MAG: MBL fold metallo-hydrolase [Sedimentisphaerales bacterium]